MQTNAVGVRAADRLTQIGNTRATPRIRHAGATCPIVVTHGRHGRIVRVFARQGSGNGLAVSCQASPIGGEKPMREESGAAIHRYPLSSSRRPKLSRIVLISAKTFAGVKRLIFSALEKDSGVRLTKLQGFFVQKQLIRPYGQSDTSLLRSADDSDSAFDCAVVVDRRRLSGSYKAVVPNLQVPGKCREGITGRCQLQPRLR